MRRQIILCSVIGLTFVLAGNAWAQTVQLPTFRYFSVDTTVSVPDRGGAFLGGVNRASSGSTTQGFGPLRNRAIGGSTGASGVSVHATIIDHEELDREVLAEAARRRGGGDYVLRETRPLSPEEQRIASKAEFLSRNVATREKEIEREVVAEPVLSLSAIRDQALRREQRLETEAEMKLAAGIAAEEAGKFASARGYYEAILRMNVTNVREEAAQRLSKIALPKKKTSPP